ncbi:hypothetical protein MNY66_04010 [Moellerella wisconsensis]|uniref:hypothetical protein n=1 Tax=Moellerella wisconsensis TaxID=158849 RepID=UPI001F4D79B4|nr:hypothetical protein [Moellerella wisconsensis]UNH43155.1 hypothetical protein MNY66_04010 [Moellerella wisconsensis]
MSVTLFCQGRLQTEQNSIIAASLQAAIQRAQQRKTYVSIWSFIPSLDTQPIDINQFIGGEYTMVENSQSLSSSLINKNEVVISPAADQAIDQINIWLSSTPKPLILLLFPLIDEATRICQQWAAHSDIIIAEQPQNRLLRLQIDYRATKVCVI